MDKKNQKNFVILLGGARCDCDPLTFGALGGEGALQFFDLRFQFENAFEMIAVG